MQFTAKTLTDALKRLDYPVFKGDYNLNLVGIRSKDTDANSFNDCLVVLYELDRKQVMHVFPMTADPGLYYRENPLSVDGTAVLVPGHYRSCWQLGAHQGKYKALVQRGPMSVYRDANSDQHIDADADTIQNGLFGINLHRASANTSSLRVDRWSAGCQVLASPEDFDLVMALANKSAVTYGRRFSYTLLEEGDLE
ncbi:hypothetical protein [Methylophaga sp. OBS4]|uniref:hypothetical protein n=1 Tax=Methylophaga sp. OBS4 TaxID=2991935 RepID=UPI0022511E1D|nr:hypothetical protein [Methylophaga sp. OBS4]MCX4187169.1 hypothetical protein [Methylophaga sp. OBS4]